MRWLKRIVVALSMCVLLAGCSSSSSNGGGSTSTPAPAPVVSDITVIDMNTEPNILRNYLGIFNVADGSLHYVANCHELVPGWEPWIPSGADGSALENTGDRLRQWFNNLLNTDIALLKANPRIRVTAIANDGPDRCGSRVGPVIVQRLINAGIDSSRVSLGEIYYP